MNTHKIYIDDSGHPKNTRTSLICLVIIFEENVLHVLTQDIEAFKYGRFKNFRSELHFNKESFGTKRKFFDMISKYPIILRYYQNHPMDIMDTPHERLLAALTNNRDLVAGSDMFIDGNFTKKQRRVVMSETRKGLRDRGIWVNSVTFIDSKTSALIQLADMCAGCIRRRIERGTVEDRELFDMIKHLIK